MGAGAYNRGSKAIREQINNDYPMRPVEFEMMDRLNGLPKYEDAGTPFGPVEIVHDNRGLWWVECPKTGFGFWYKTLFEAVKRWNIRIVAYNGAWLAVPAAQGGE